MSTAAQPVAAGAEDQRRESFLSLIEEHKSMVYSLAYHSFQDAALAEEIAQEVFLELHKNLERLDGAGHVKNWLRKVTLNRCIDQSRRRKLRPNLGLGDVPEPAVPAPDTDPLLEARLRRMVASLPEKLRAVVILRYQEDLSLREIGTVLGLPAQTVKSRLHRSIEMLRAKLKPGAQGREP
ncbi:MAG: RNA polymerase sigma factor [Bryobacteraceae bacterium]